MSDFRFTILAALCGFAVVQGDPTLLVDIDKVVIKNTDNPYFGEWSYTLTPGKPQNKVSIIAPVKADVPEDLVLKMNVKSNGKQLPVVETTFCKAMQDEIIGKGCLARGSPFPKACPIKKGDYKIVDYVVKNDKLPPGLPDGRMVGIVEYCIPGGQCILTIEFEGEISHNFPAIG